jgi:hypothetical protein
VPAQVLTLLEVRLDLVPFAPHRPQLLPSEELELIAVVG